MKRLLAIAVSASIMAVIFSRIDTGQLGGYVRQMDARLFVLAVLFFVPQIATTAFRWRVMVRGRVEIGFGEAAALILACNALNILLPSRVGDLSKAYFMGRDAKLEIKRGMNVVFFEKYIDLASLGIVILTGVLIQGRFDGPALAGSAFAASMIAVFPALYFLKIDRWVSGPLFDRHRFLEKIRRFLLETQSYLNELKANRRRLCFVVLISVFLWYLHILQFYVLFLSLHSGVSVFEVFRLVPLAILVGLVPLTIAGVGTRDSALLYFFAPYESASLVAGVGIFASLRYFVPGALGLPFLNRYLLKDSGKILDRGPDDAGR